MNFTDIVPRDFNGFNINLTINNHQPIVRGIDLCRALGYKNAESSESKLYNRYKIRFEALGVFRQLGDKPNGNPNDGRPSYTRWYNRKSAIFLIIKSNTNKALDLQVFISDMFDELLSGQNFSIVTNPDISNALLDPNDYESVLGLTGSLKEAQTFINNLCIALDIKIDSLLNRQDRLEEKVHSLDIIDRGQATNIRKLILIWVEHKLKENNPYFQRNEVISKLFRAFENQFNILSYRELPFSKYDQAVSWLTEQLRISGNLQKYFK